MSEDSWIEIKPELPEGMKEFISFMRKLSRGKTADVLVPNQNPRIEFVSRIIKDLVATGWSVKVERKRLFLRPLHDLEERGVASKEILRGFEQIRRDAQLTEPSVKTFIEGMEKRRLRAKGWHSIFSVMRDGRLLYKELAKADKLRGEERIDFLKTVISPYVQVAEANSVCDHTGLNLFDIWRYFRHTWVNQYQSTPGRNLHLLIRDAAAPNHPIIGIAALGSAVVQQTCRDRALGWDPESFIERLKQNHKAKYTQWLFGSISRMIEELYKEDLIADEVLALHDLEIPSKTVINRLTEESRRCALKHERITDVNAFREDLASNKIPLSWISLARSDLYRSKRCKLLADFLKVRMVLAEHNLGPGKEKELRAALTSSRVAQAVTSIVRRIKSERVGIDIMDVTVCGALAPYNLLLGGKLVCMLLTSPSVGMLYEQKYRNYESIIASGLSGKPVNRRPTLIALGTTSLYGCGSSQYNRVNIPGTLFSKPNEFSVRFAEIGTSKGFGTFHFSKETLQAMDQLLQLSKTNKVNYIFGEGVNPKLRKLRDAIDLVGLPSNTVLNHGCLRLVYLVTLISNPSEFLLGMEKIPKWLIPRKDPAGSTALIAKHWTERWLSMRITTPGILEKVGQHTLGYPITHGARVILPNIANDENKDLQF